MPSLQVADTAAATATEAAAAAVAEDTEVAAAATAAVAADTGYVNGISDHNLRLIKLMGCPLTENLYPRNFAR